jgi:hypothetical protein
MNFEQARIKLVNAVLSSELDLKDSVLASLNTDFYEQFNSDEQFVLRRLAGDLSSSYIVQQILQNQQLQPA